MGRPRRRQGALLVTVLALLAVFGARLVYLQGFRGQAVAQEALASRLTPPITLLAPRGQITDATGVVLATSVERYTVVADQTAVAGWVDRTDPRLAGPAGAAHVLAPLLGLNDAELGARLVGTARYTVIARSVLPEVWRAVQDLRVAGITAERTDERTYPDGSVSGRVLGWVDRDGAGVQGIEGALNDRLAGTPGSLVYERGLGGQQIPGGYQRETPAVPGEAVQLTLLSDLQWKAEEAIRTQVAATGASSGALVALDVTTGEVLALADSRSLDPNDPGASADLGGPSALTDIFEPGSTAKIITMAELLDAGLADPSTQYQVTDTYTTPNGQTFTDSHPHGVENLTLTGILAKSSNSGTVMVGQDVPAQVRYDYLAKFGFGSRTGVELRDEPGILLPLDRWDGRTKYTVLFGQGGISVTALQATTVYATIANHGVRVQPHLVKGWTAADGTAVPAEPAAATQVVSARTADTLLTMLESAVDEGTGSAAAIPGYRVAGKTGTAQKFAPAGITASFIGVAPADSPRIAVGVFLQDPKTSVYGGDVAAPVFSAVAGYALQELDVAPSGAPATLFPTTW